MPNAPYAWAIIPTSFPNQGVCSSYYTSCSTEYGKCTAKLGGGVNGVTIDAGNGAGVTVQGATATADAARVCQSISAQACFGLPLTYCAQLPTGSAGVGGTGGGEKVGGQMGVVVVGALMGVLGGWIG